MFLFLKLFTRITAPNAGLATVYVSSTTSASISGIALVGSGVPFFGVGHSIQYYSINTYRTLAGSSLNSGYAVGAGTNVRFSFGGRANMVMVGTLLYVADVNNHMIRAVSTSIG